MMASKNYPQYYEPTGDFMKRLAAKQDPDLVITDMQFVERWKGCYGATFSVRVKGERLIQDVTVGKQFYSEAALEDYLLNALAPEGQFA
jgi:hypothetical protein